MNTKSEFLQTVLYAMPMICLIAIILSSCGIDAELYETSTYDEIVENTSDSSISFLAEPEQYLSIEESIVISGNTNNEHPSSIEYGTTIESEDNDEISPIEIKAVLDPHANSTSTWARSDTYFFFTHNYVTIERTDYSVIRHVDGTLYRLLLKDIEQGERIVVPGNGEIKVVGISESYLFISRVNRNSDNHFSQFYDIYRISLETLETTPIHSGLYSGVPLIHLPSNSILLPHANFDRRMAWVEALHLDTGTRHIVYEFETHNFDSPSMGWWLMENDAVIFIDSGWGGTSRGSNFILINPELHAKQLDYHEIYGTPSQILQPQNPAEEFIFGLEEHSWNRWFDAHATIGEWIYYLWSEERSWRNNLYRIKLDSTQNTLIQENANIRSLLNVNDMLFVTVLSETEEIADASWYDAVLLSQDYSIVKVLGSGWDGHNSYFRMQHLAGTDMIMIMQLSFFRIDGVVDALYCTTTGALFSLDTPSNSLFN